MRAVSIMILTLNSEKDLEKCLKSILGQDYPKQNIEIAIVDSGSTDKTLEIAKKFNVRIINCPKKGFPAARNLALNSAKNEIIVFTDSDCFAGKTWLEELVKCFEIEGVEAAGGPSTPPKTNLLGYCISALGYPAGGIRRAFEKPGFTAELSTCNFAMKKSLVQKAGFFDENMVFGSEDTDFVKRISKVAKMYFNPKAVVEHRPRESFAGFIKWWYRRGKADVQFHKKYLLAFPRSLVSPKVSRLQHTIFLFILAAFAYLLNPVYLWIFLLLVLACIFFRIWAKQKDYAIIKDALPINGIWFWTLVPLLNYLKDLIRDIGRIKGLVSYYFSATSKK